MTKKIKELQKENELVTEKIMSRLKELGVQNTANPIVVAKLYKPCCDGSIYLTDDVGRNELIRVYCLARNAKNDEWVFSSRATLQSFRCEDHGLPLQRDTTFTERKFIEILKEKRIRGYKTHIRTISKPYEKTN